MSYHSWPIIKIHRFVPGNPFLHFPVDTIPEVVVNLYNFASFDLRHAFSDQFPTLAQFPFFAVNLTVTVPNPDYS
jgi:hypothetical protein